MQCSLSVSLYRKSISASILCVVLFVPGTVTLLYDVMRTSFDFHIGFCNILSHNSHTKQLDSANACHDTYQRRPAGNRIPEYQCAYDFRDDCNKRNHGEHQPQIRGNLQRNIRKIDNPIKRIAHKFPEIPLGFSRRTFYIFKFQPFGIISDPGKDSFGNRLYSLTERMESTIARFIRR